MNRLNTKFVFVGALVVLVAACSGGHHAPGAPTPEQAQVAMQASLDQDAQEQRSMSGAVTAVAIGQCTASSEHAITACDVHWSIDGQPVDGRVAFYTTPNPAHPWRAHFLPSKR
jgi:hypothetical protein